MNLARIAGWMALVGLICLPQAALAKWVEARSENFVFYGDTSERRAEQVLTELEKYRMIVFRLYNIEGEPEMQPLRIYATRSDGDISDMTGSENASGVYKVRRESPLFILNIDGGFNNRSQAKAIALHEYTHHLLARYTDQMYPRWVNEGMAEYLSTFRIDNDGEVTIGIPKDGRGWALANYDWIDWDILTGSIRRYPYRSDGRRSTEIAQQLFYAQSWLAVHYLLSTDGMADKLSEYVQGIPQATDPKGYFTEVFGMTPEALGEVLEEYFDDNSYPGQRLTLADVDFDFDITVRDLTKAERDFHRGEAVRQFRGHSEEGRELAEEYYAESLERDGPQAQIEASRALLALDHEEYEASRQHAAAALSLAPEDSRVLHTTARVDLETYLVLGTGDGRPGMDTIRDRLKDAMRADPLNMEAHFDYVRTYAETGDRPSAQAIYSAKECTHHYRTPALLGENMMLANVLMRAGEDNYARFHIDRAARWAPTPQMRRMARRMLDQLN